MKKIGVVIVAVILMGIAGIYVWGYRDRPEFYVGRWEAELTRFQREEAGLEKLIYEIGDGYFIESSIYVTNGIRVLSSTRTVFVMKPKGKDEMTGIAKSRELIRFESSFTEPGCGSTAECERRELVKNNIEKLTKNSLVLYEGESNTFEVRRVSKDEILMVSSYGLQTLRRIH